MTHSISCAHNPILYNKHRKGVVVLLGYLSQQLILVCQPCLEQFEERS